MFTQFTCFDIGMASIMDLVFQEVKGLYSEKTICLCTRLEEKQVRMQNFRSSTAMVIELRFFMKKKMKMNL